MTLTSNPTLPFRQSRPKPSGRRLHAKLSKFLRSIIRLRRNRQARAKLMAMPGHMLKAIGLARIEIDMGVWGFSSERGRKL